MPKGGKMIPYLGTENLKNHTLSRGTYLYSPYMGVPPPPREGLLPIYFIECLHFHFYLFARKKQNVTCGRPFNRQKTTEICHFFVSTFWCLQLDKPTLLARGFFVFVLFWITASRSLSSQNKTKKNLWHPAG